LSTRHATEGYQDHHYKCVFHCQKLFVQGSILFKVVQYCSKWLRFSYSTLNARRAIEQFELF
jgi:hypothetical protein